MLLASISTSKILQISYLAIVKSRLLFGVSVPSLLSLSVQASFSLCGLFGRELHESDLTRSELIAYPDYELTHGTTAPPGIRIQTSIQEK